MHRLKWGRILLTACLAATAGFAGYKSAADTVIVKFKGYQQIASWSMGTDTGFVEGQFVCIDGVIGNAATKSVSVYAFSDTGSAWTEVTTGLVDAPNAEIQSPGQNLAGTGSCTASGIAGNSWSIDLNTGDVVEGPVSIDANAALSDPTEIVSGKSRQTTRNRLAGTTVRTNSHGKTGFGASGEGGISADGTPIIEDGSSVWSANSSMSNVHEGTTTHQK